MPEVTIRVVRWVSDDPFPGIVEGRLVDAEGVEHVIIEKSAICDDADRLRPDASYPIELKLGCRVINEDDTDLEIELGHHVESVDGQRVFRVSVSAMRRDVQLGHRPRRLQLNATTISSWQVWHRTRVKPCARMPQRR